MNHYWFSDYASNTGSHTLCLVPQQIVDLQVLGETFDPAEFTNESATAFVPQPLVAAYLGLILYGLLMGTGLGLRGWGVDDERWKGVAW